MDYVWEQSQGQPWIVCSLFMRATMRVLSAESAETVSIEHIRAARAQMIEGRETHFDALGERLRDPRVKRVIQAVLTGEADQPLSPYDPDVVLTTDLGLITFDKNIGFVIANPLYEEMFLRFLSIRYHNAAPSPSTWRWQKPDGALDMDALLREFQDFWQTNSDVWKKNAEYVEAFPHLMLLAFLQRVTNGSGHIEREYAAGSGRMDIAVEYNGKWNILEIKLRRHSQTFEWVKGKGLTQIRKYRDNFPKTEGAYLVIFDRRTEAQSLPWDEKLKWEQEDDVTVVGC
jgi:hypothetical protein